MALTAGIRKLFARPARPPAALLIGTPDSLPALRRLLAGGAPQVRAIGCLLDAPAPRRCAGLPVLGTLEDAEQIAQDKQLRHIYISLPAPRGQQQSRLALRLQQQGLDVCCVPTPTDLLGGGATLPARRLDLARLLDRSPRPIDRAAVSRTLQGKRILITGAGGSIGAELARIAAEFDPACLLLMDRSENGLFEIDRELAARHGQLRRRAILHDVTDADRTTERVLEHRPDVIFHAAAHKHVPMMEDHPREAVINNFFGTKAIADAAHAAGAERFVMVSTDKAVNPTSVMGATKRMAERYVQHLAGRSACTCSMVRFGNVLGSACSVIPIWQQQLAGGGPLTVTDDRMTRYFMTIPEAAALVIQAAALDQANGQVFVLDMGEPIRILDLAERFVREHGLEPGRDVPIVLTQARPGEKLYEELAYESEDMLPTAHQSVRIVRTEPPAPGDIAHMVRTLGELRAHGSTTAILQAVWQNIRSTNGNGPAEAGTAEQVIQAKAVTGPRPLSERAERAA